MNEYQEREHNQKVELAKTLTDLSGLNFYIEAGNDNDYNQVILAGDIPIKVNHMVYQKTYSFFLDHHLPYVRYETQKREAETLGQPLQVHKLNGKKIIAWVNHLTTLYAKLNEVSRERIEAVNQFLEAVKLLGGTIPKLDPHYHNGEGEIVKNGILFKYEIHDEGYIHKNIDIHYTVGDNLHEFEQLADNTWIKPE